MTAGSKPSLPYPILCLVTQLSYAQGQTLPALIDEALKGGVNMVQLREKELPTEELLALAMEVREVTLGRALFLVNQRPDVALAAGADGVHLGEEAMPVKAARHRVGDRHLIGRSVHSLAGAQEAEAQGADLLVVGTIFPSVSKPGVKTAGLGLLSQVARAITIPFLAIGGVEQGNVAQVMERGCSGVAVISAILGAADPRQAARELVEKMLPTSTHHPRRGTGSTGVAASMAKTGIITLTVNGKVRELKGPTTLERFLRDHGVNMQFVAVAYNGTVLRREEFGEITLNKGDTVEIVRPVGGG